jgi:hypothetical protein
MDRNYCGAQVPGPSRPPEFSHELCKFLPLFVKYSAYTAFECDPPNSLKRRSLALQGHPRPSTATFVNTPPAHNCCDRAQFVRNMQSKCEKSSGRAGRYPASCGPRWEWSGPVLRKNSVHGAGPLIFEGSHLPKVWTRMSGDFNRALTTLLVEAAV